MTNSAIQYEPCVVSFIDVLGFRNLLGTRSAADIYGLLTQLEKFTRPDEEVPARSMDEVRLQSRAFAFTVSHVLLRRHQQEGVVHVPVPIRIGGDVGTLERGHPSVRCRFTAKGSKALDPRSGAPWISV